MNWIALAQLLEQTPASRPVALCPALEHEALRQQALRQAGGLRSRNITRLALHLEDAGELAIALLGAWRAGVTVLLPADLQPATRQRLADQADLWLTDQAGDSTLAELLGDALPAAPLAGARSVTTGGRNGARTPGTPTLRTRLGIGRSRVGSISNCTVETW